MIHNGKSGKTAQKVAPDVNSAMENRIADLGKVEAEVVKWVKSNPVLGIGIALAVGVGMGLVLKRRR